MEISDKQYLSALMTAMYVTKWDSDDDNSHVVVLLGSPYFAKIYNDVVDELINFDSNKPAAIVRWKRWRAIEERPVQLERTRARIRSIDLWQSWSRELKQHMVECLLSPFTATSETMEELLSM